MAILTGISGSQAKIGDDISILLNKWDGKQFYLLTGDDIWLTFELTKNEKQALTKQLIKDWLR